MLLAFPSFVFSKSQTDVYVFYFISGMIIVF